MVKFNISDVNQFDDGKLISVFGNVIESYPDAVLPVFSKKPFATVNDVCTEFATHLENLSSNDKFKILSLHPILAGKAADKNELTSESTQEQKSAELNTLEIKKKQEFNEFNTRYLEKFGFPFVICARENKAVVMMDQIQIRLKNNTEEEINTGINEVKKICGLRIMDIIND